MAYIYKRYIHTDFDEETADDKDIDMGIYYGHSEGNVKQFCCLIFD